MLKKFLMATVFTALITTASAKNYTYEDFKSMAITDFDNVSADDIEPLCNRRLELLELKKAGTDTKESRKEKSDVTLKISRVKNGYQTCDLLYKKHGHKPWLK